MTGGPTVLCSRCGFANVPGDQFCGSCGAFLEWEGAAAGTGAVASTDSAPATAPNLAQTQAFPAPPAATFGDAAHVEPIAPPGVAPAAEGLIRCPACGIANAASRTFCQTCGAKLSPAARIETRSRDEIAAAVAAVPRVAPPPPVPPAGVPVPGGAVRSAPQRRRGLPGWIFVVLLLGILAGVAAVGGSRMLQGAGPASAASAEASASSGASVAPSTSAAGPSASAASASAAATALPAATALKLTGASASSIVNGDTARYGPQNAIDGNLKTSWQEGMPNEKGQWLEVSFDPATVTALVIRNGYQASTALYKGNLRLKDITITVDGGPPVSVRLKDSTSAQRIDLAPTAGATHLRITIVTTYPSVKTAVAGTPFDDAAVSEVSVLGVPGS